MSAALIGDSYESALHGLLALGRNGSPSMQPLDDGLEVTETPTVSEEVRSPVSVAYATPFVPQTTSMPIDLGLPSTRSPATSTGNSLFDLSYSAPSHERILELLRYFRYEVAPWVSLVFSTTKARD